MNNISIKRILVVVSVVSAVIATNVNGSDVNIWIVSSLASLSLSFLRV